MTNGTIGFGHAPVQPVPEPERVHALLDRSIEQLTQGWLDQLKALRQNIDGLESILVRHAAATKNSISQLHEMGELVAQEADRGRALCAKLADGIEQLNPPS